MKLTITNALICDPQSPFNRKKCDLRIESGVITGISAAKKGPAPAGKVIDAKGAVLSPGFFDMRASLREPGTEYKETLESAAAAAAAGGYTTITCLPDTTPVLQHKADIEFILRKAEPLAVHILPFGAVSANREGKDMAELYDLHKAGAVAFTDANKPVMHAGLMERAMEYSKIFGGLIISHAEDANLSGTGMMHEGAMSTSLGVKGVPNIAEELMVNRDIELARYTVSPVHFSHISSKGSVDIIRRARRQGLPVTCDVAVASLVWTDEMLGGFDSNFKLTPPLRSASDKKALWDGLADGTIDCIVSDHTPEDTEHKEVEFEYAAQGMIQLQTAYALLQMHLPRNTDQDMLVRALCINPRKILKQAPVSLQEGSPAELTIADPEALWTYDPASNLSLSRNSPVLGQQLKGKVLATVNKDQLFKH